MKAMVERLSALEEAGLRRRLTTSAGIDLTSNDVLGLSRDAQIAQAIRQALDEGLPTGSTGSRLLSGHGDHWAELEARFAAWQGRQASLFFATGYSANVGLLSSVIEAGDTVLSDALNHASLIDGLRLSKAHVEIVEHLNLDAYETALKAAGPGAWVVVESVFSMDGDLAPLEELTELARRYRARLLVDEAHATGIFGPQGAGRCQQLAPDARPFASIHPCGKALGLSGAFVCAERATIEWLVNRARSFVYSTAPSPLLAPALQAALDRVQSLGVERSRALSLADRLRRQLAGRVDCGRSNSHIVPILIGSVDAALAAQQAMQERGWDLRAIRPPTVPAGQCRLRVVLRADLSDEEIDQLAKDLIDVA